MIRREMDEGAAWCLVPQIDHAHLAAEIAAHWRPLQDEEPAIRADLIAAVQHHDDGWCDFDATAHLDPAVGLPIAFYELPYGQDNQIWARSIRAAEELGPLPAYLVARHFLRLRPLDPEADPDGLNAEFVEHFESECERWLTDWAALRADGNVNRSLAEKTVDYLQFFDLLSLMICLGRGMPPQTYETPAATQVSLQRRGLWEYHLSPRELSLEKLEIELSSYRLPARNYPSDQEMKQELVAEKVNLRLVSAE